MSGFSKATSFKMLKTSALSAGAAFASARRSMQRGSGKIAMKKLTEPWIDWIAGQEKIAQ